MSDYTWINNTSSVDWDELYRVAPLGTKPPAALKTVFGNSMFVRFAYADGGLAGAGRALADGLDCAYIADVAVHPDRQGHGLGKAIIGQLVAAAGHKKIILYARPGTEGFYTGQGFLQMNTAMAIWHDPADAISAGLLRETSALCRYASSGLAENPCFAEEKESKTTTNLPPSIEFPFKSLGALRSTAGRAPEWRGAAWSEGGLVRRGRVGLEWRG